VDGQHRLSVALSLTGAGVHGIIVQLQGLQHASFGGSKGSVEISAEGDGEWRIPFAGGVTGHAAEAKVTITAAFATGIAVSTTGVQASVGDAAIAAVLASAAPIWRLEAGFGDPAKPGLAASLDLGSLIGHASIFDIELPAKSFSPHVSVAQGAEPVFSLGEGG
jgi:hypothetical protein